uniref:Ground-like domain-containing protein n=1 Tax=Syphacia muris TaxID=451379 RepID=A0A0N5ATJ4_9BILA
MLHWLLLLFAPGVTLNLVSAANCCCGIQCVIKCPAPPVCPKPPPCIQQTSSIAVVCKAKQCPPPPPCPAPPPCPPPEPCDPCPECPPPPPPPPPCPECPSLTPAACPPPTCPPPPPCPASTITTTIQTDCCEGCTDNSGCSARFKNRKYAVRSRSRSRRMHRNARVKRELVNHEIFNDLNSTCNSDILMKIMISDISKNVEESKRNIQKDAEAAIQQKFNVICSEGAFSYVAHTNTFCQASVNGVHCYAFSF